MNVINYNNILKQIVTFILFVFVFYFCSLPIVSVILYGINSSNDKKIEISDILRALMLLKDSTVLAFLVAITAVLFALIITFTLHRINFKGRSILRILILLPLVNPAFVGSISFFMLFGKRGLITNKLLGLNISPFGFHGVFIVETLTAITTAYLILSSSIRNIDISLEEAAKNIGASEIQTLFKITLPMMLPEITASFLMIFLIVMADFTTPMIVGGNFRTLATDLYLQITGLYDMKIASLSGMFLLIPCSIIFFIQNKITENKNYVTDKSSSKNIEYYYVNPIIKLLLIIITCAVIFYFLVNFIFIIIGALTVNWGYDYSFTLKHVISAFSSGSSKYIKPFINSIQLSVITAFSSSIIGIIIAYLIERKKIRNTKCLEIMTIFPAAVPGILFGIGYLVTFKYPLFGIGKYIFTNAEPLILLGSSLIVYIICISRNINIAMKSCHALLEHIDKELENASYNLGATTFQTYRYIIIPLLRDSFSNSYIKIFASTMTSLGAIIFLLMPKNKVIVQVLFQSFTGGMSLGVPAVLALTLSFITLLLMFVFKAIFYRGKLHENRTSKYK